MRHCSVAYAYYESDYRVRRYSELFSNNKNNTVHVLSVKRNDDADQVELNGVRVFQIQIREPNERTRAAYLYRLLKFLAKATIKLTLLHARFRYDVIHVHNMPDFLVFCTFIPRLLGAKVILDIHDVMPELYREKFQGSGNGMPSRALLALERASVAFSAHVIVANDLWKQRVLCRTKSPQQKFTSLLNYPNLAFYPKYERTFSVEKLDIVYPGHVSHQHGVDIVVKAMVAVRRIVPFARLYIYAVTFEGTYMSDLQKTIRDSGLTECVLFRRPVAPERMGSVLRDVEIGIVTKRGTVFGAEAFSTKILDFFAAGLPVVCAKTRIEEHYFSEEYLEYFEDNNVDDCARKIVSLWYDVGKRKKLSDAGRDYVRENNWGTKSHLYLQLLQGRTDCRALAL